MLSRRQIVLYFLFCSCAANTISQALQMTPNEPHKNGLVSQTRPRRTIWTSAMLFAKRFRSPGEAKKGLLLPGRRIGPEQTSINEEVEPPPESLCAKLEYL